MAKKKVTKSVPRTKRGANDNAMFAVSYRRFLTWKTAWVFESETDARNFARERERIDNLNYKVERVTYMA